MRKLLLIFISFIVVFPVLAQEENLYQIVTPYEKARESASEIWLKDFSENATPQELSSCLKLIGLLESKDNEGEIEKMVVKEAVIGLHCRLSETITPQTWADYKSQQKLTPICEKYAELIAEAEKLRSDEDIEREKKRNSPMGLLKKKCNQDFSKWAVKSEFEKNIEWSNRIQSKGNAKFDAICSSYYLSSWHNAERAFNNYDAETESFSLTLTYYNQGKVGSSLTGYCVVKDNPQFAKQFLKDHESYINSFDCEGKLMNVNGYIYPKRVTIGNTYTFIFPIPDNAQDVVVCNNITGYCFDYQRWKKSSDSLQHITDSLEILRKNVNIKKSQLLDSLKLYEYLSSYSSYKRYCNVYKEILKDKNGYDLMGADTAFTNMVPRVLLKYYGALQYLFENQSEFYQFFKTFRPRSGSDHFDQLKNKSIQRLQEKLKESNLTDGSELHNNPSHPLAKEIVSYINAIRFYDKMRVEKGGLIGYCRREGLGTTYVHEFGDIRILHDWADNYKYLRKGIKQSYREDYGLYVFDFFLEYINGN